MAQRPGQADFNCANDIMAILTDPTLAPASLHAHRASWFVLNLSVYLFPVVAIVSSIPVFSIVVKYNCIENGWSKGSASAWVRHSDSLF